MARDTHTHRGHCPACGAIHAVSTNETLVAKHGYTTYWGYFDNICEGADHTPLEIDKTFTEKFIGKLKEFITETKNELANFTRVEGVSCRFRVNGDDKRIEGIPASPSSYYSYKSNYKIEYIPVDEIENVINSYKYLHGYSFEDYKYDEKTVEEIIEEANKKWIDDRNREIEGAKSHIEFLKGLIDTVHGKPLLNVADGGKILKDMETEVAEGWDEHVIETHDTWGDGRRVYEKKRYLAGWEKSITKSVSIGDITLKIMRGNTYRNEGGTYRCYFFLNDEKIAKKKLLEALGSA